MRNIQVGFRGANERIRRAASCVLAGIFLIAAGSCSSSPSNPELAAIVGAYALTTVQGSSFPFVRTDDGQTKQEVIGGTADLRGDFSFRVTYTVRTTVSGAATLATEIESGTYTEANNVLDFSSNLGSSKAYFTGGKVTRTTASGVIEVFTKQS